MKTQIFPTLDKAKPDTGIIRGLNLAAVKHTPVQLIRLPIEAWATKDRACSAVLSLDWQRPRTCCVYVHATTLKIQTLNTFWQLTYCCWQSFRQMTDPSFHQRRRHAWPNRNCQRWGSTPRQTDWLTLGRNVTLTLTLVESCSCEQSETGSWVRGKFGKLEEGKRPSLWAVIKQRLMMTEKTSCVL
jgi:hypothetical protein